MFKVFTGILCLQGYDTRVVWYVVVSVTEESAVPNFSTEYENW